jgi:hypothetical protein
LAITRHTHAAVPTPPATKDYERPRGAAWFSAGPGWKELEKVAISQGCDLSSFNHTEEGYERILSKSQPGSTLVLLFALDHADKDIPEKHRDLLPMPWTEIEAALKRGETVERAGKARERNIVLLAAPTELQLNNLIQKSRLLSGKPRDK